MAEKSFGVKDLNIVGATGDPTIESNGDLNLKAGQVAIQTNTTVTGVVTATAFFFVEEVKRRLKERKELKKEIVEELEEGTIGPDGEIVSSWGQWVELDPEKE